MARLLLLVALGCAGCGQADPPRGPYFGCMDGACTLNGDGARQWRAWCTRGSLSWACYTDELECKKARAVSPGLGVCRRMMPDELLPR